jgi:CTP synthase (UTP-ammonia lyase)
MDPELFDIEHLKTFGMWPNTNLISFSIGNYTKRMREDKLAMLIVNDLKGENAYNFLENNNKIIKINIVNKYDDTTEQYKRMFDDNTKSFKGKIDFGISKDKRRDIVCIEKSSCTEENLELYYKNVKSGGIFCGNGHESQSVKSALKNFRHKIKIGTPIQVCYTTTWFWYVR